MLKWGDIPERGLGGCVSGHRKREWVSQDQSHTGSLCSVRGSDVSWPSISWKQELFLKSIPSPAPHSELECLECGLLGGPRRDKAHGCTALEAHNWNELTSV